MNFLKEYWIINNMTKGYDCKCSKRTIMHHTPTNRNDHYKAAFIYSNQLNLNFSKYKNENFMLCYTALEKKKKQIISIGIF